MKNRILLSALCLIVISSGCSILWGEGNAKIRSIGITDVRGGPGCWLTLEFLKYPKEGDLKDIKVVFTSQTINGKSQSFGWEFIASKALIKKPDSNFGRLRAEGISSNKRPVLNYPIDVFFPVKFKHRLEGHESRKIVADLFWADKMQDQTSKYVDHLYKRDKNSQKNPAGNPPGFFI